MATINSVIADATATAEQAISVVFGRTDGDGDVDARKLNISTAAALAFKELCTQAIESWSSRVAQAYTSDAELDRREVFLLDTKKDLDELKAFSDLASGASTLAASQPSALDLSVQFYAVVVGDRPEDRVVFVRRTDPSISFGSGKFLATGRQSLDKLDGPVFSFSPGFDLVIRPGRWALILNQLAFERLIRETGIMNANIHSWVESLHNQIALTDDSRSLLETVARDDSRTWRKLREIERRGHLASVTIEDVKRYAKDVDLDPDKIVQGNQLVFDPAERFSFLHLLNEDLYQGPLTEQRFEAQRKSAV